jgi:galacturan 1,4-alpha-galacturonidase
MKFLTLGALLVGAVAAVSTGRVPQGAQIIAANDKSSLRNIGAHGQKYPDRRTVTIRPSKNDTDDISDDFLWGIKRANHGGRLLLKKGKTYVIGKKLDLSFLDNIEVQLEGEIKVGSVCQEELEINV